METDLTDLVAIDRGVFSVGEAAMAVLARAQSVQKAADKNASDNAGENPADEDQGDHLAALREEEGNQHEGNSSRCLGKFTLRIGVTEAGKGEAHQHAADQEQNEVAVAEIPHAAVSSGPMGQKSSFAGMGKMAEAAKETPAPAKDTATKGKQRR